MVEKCLQWDSTFEYKLEGGSRASHVASEYGNFRVEGKRTMSLSWKCVRRLKKVKWVITGKDEFSEQEPGHIVPWQGPDQGLPQACLLCVGSWFWVGNISQYESRWRLLRLGTVNQQGRKKKRKQPQRCSALAPWKLYRKGVSQGWAAVNSLGSEGNSDRSEPRRVAFSSL